MNKWVLTSGPRKEQATVRSSHSFLPLALLHICPSKCAKHICPPHPTPSLLNQTVLRFLCVCVCDKHLVCVCVCVSRSVVPNSLRPHGLQSTRFLCPWDFPGRDTGVGCHFLLQGIFPTQGSNLGLLHCRQILYRLSYKGSPVYQWYWPVIFCFCDTFFWFSNRVTS